MTADRRLPASPPDDAIVGRLGARLGALLAERSEMVPHDVAERLRVAREQALVRARRTRTVAVPERASVPLAVGGGTAALGGGDGASWWQRFASLAPLALLVLGLFLIEHLAVHEQALAAAEFDTALLADDLPPTAYSDPGFAEFLRNSPP